MNIAIYGAGRIGSSFAFHLAKGGHEITMVARGKRLAELTANPAIETIDGRRAEVKVAAELDPATPFDLVLVTVLAHQVDPTLPALKASAATKVMFMFNTVEPLARLRDAVGAGRFEFAFPTVIAFFENGKLRGTVNGPGNLTVVTSDEWARVFSNANIPAKVHPDMESFLRSHAAAVIPLMAIGCAVSSRAGGLKFGEASRYAAVLREGFGVVRRLGNSLTPGAVAFLAILPRFLVALMFWAASRAGAVRDLGKMGPGEVRALVDAMEKLAPGTCPEMLALRP